MEGFLLINKPAGMTSFNCVRQIRKIVGKSFKVGHAGTLDHFATGLLIIGIGRQATKLLGRLLQMPKTYFGTGKLGQLTDTYDPAGRIIVTNHKSVNKSDLQEALKSFEKGYLQTPPVYSALKFQGQRLSDLQRVTELADEVHKIAISKQRYVNLYSLELKSFEYPYFTIESQVSSGTYIRALINDIAIKLDNCATTVQLNRLAIGPFLSADGLDLSELNLDLIKSKLIPVNELLSRLDSYDLNIKLL